ncbi:hypothetical protein ACIPVK_13250 [Paeniglutamicibacter sp. MACA_103]|uniref:hypothetical protein n=1 Tax=Paeniglutamicibacter sp. MACA_103 TaxID=3377337 RepID=UPI0038966FE4
MRELGIFRERGFAANSEGTGGGVSALGMADSDAAGQVFCGIRVAIPKIGFRQVFDAGLFGDAARPVKRLEGILREVDEDSKPG